MGYVCRFLASTLALVVLMSLTTSAAFAQDPDMGKTIWEEEVWQCSRCHGAAGEGAWGATLAGSEATVQDWITQVRTPRRSMPAFSEQQITDEQIGHIHAYLTSLTAPANVTRPEANLAADAHPGQVLIVEKRCVACHTETGPINGFIERGEVPTAEVVIAQLRTPRNRMPMFSESQVSDEEAGLIAEFMASEVSAQPAQPEQPAEPAQETPATLPTSGGENSSTSAVLMVLAGVGLVAASFILRRRLNRVTD